MKLYYSPGACSLSPHIALREAGLPVELHKVDLRARKLADGSDFTRINPKGYVPALGLDSGDVLTEGPAIVQYVADLRPEAGLAPPAGTFARYRLQEALNYISTELHKGFSPLFRANCPEEWKAVVRENLHKNFALVDATLARHPYFTGETFTVADGYLFTVLGWTRYVKMDLSAYPNIGAFLARVAERPAVDAALVAEGLKR